MRDDEYLKIYVGDQEGSIHLIRPETHKPDSVFIIDKSNHNYHRINIIQLLLVQKDNALYSIGFDQKVQAYEELAQKTFFTYKNPHKCLFTSMAWNADF